MQIFSVIVLLIFCNFSFAADIYGRVVKVADGDTITILDSNNRQHKIRLAQIDAPESNQPWGQKSKQALIAMIANKQVKIAVSGKDRYGRVIGTPFLGNVDICREQVKRGNAWVYTQYASDKSLVTIERQAKANKTGLWSLPENERIEPWVWRRKKK